MINQIPPEIQAQIGTSRYVAINDSYSEHTCCFGWTVVDLKDPPNGQHFTPMCETVDFETAARIVEGLELLDRLHHFQEQKGTPT